MDHHFAYGMIFGLLAFYDGSSFCIWNDFCPEILFLHAACQRYGVWADWSNPYLTLNPEYEAAQVSGASKLNIYLQKVQCIFVCYGEFITKCYFKYKRISENLYSFLSSYTVFI